MFDLHPRAKGCAVMSDRRNAVELSPDDCSHVLSGLHLQTLRRYASFFCALPSTDRRNKQDLVSWILQNSSNAILSQLMTFVTHSGAEHTTKRPRTEDGSNDNERDARRVRGNDLPSQPESRFMDIPTDTELKKCYRSFYDATSNDSLRSGICGICGRQAFVVSDQLKLFSLNEIPNRHRLVPATAHPAHELVHGLLLEPAATEQRPDGVHVHICCHCLCDLKSGNVNHPPKRSLANNLWIGNVPDVLKRLSFPEQLLIALVYPRVFVFKLFPKRSNNRFFGNDLPHLQRAMRGNVCSYELDAPGISEMVQGNLMPRQPAILASVIQITMFGQRHLPENWMKNLFRVRRNYVREALVWLKAYNPRFYGHIDISSERLVSLPVDGVPHELISIARHLEDSDIVREHDDSYVPSEDDEFGMLLHFWCFCDVY